MTWNERAMITLAAALYVIAFVLFREYLHGAATLLSLALTPATIYLSIWVCYLWWSEATSGWHSDSRSPQDYFVMGVFISFAGGAVDNTYWGLAWTAHYLGLVVTSKLFDNGVLFNLPFRQVTTALAGYFHVRASIEMAADRAHKTTGLKANVISLVAAGFVFAWILWLVK